MKEIIKKYLDEVKLIADDMNLKDIAKVITILYDAWLNNRTVYLCGNGGSASTASHFTCDLTKLGVKAHCLNDNPALITAITNDNGFENLYIEQLKNLIGAGDVLICISVHGGGVKRNYKENDELWSQNLLKAADFTKHCGARVIGLVGFEGGIIRRIADASIKIRSYSTLQIESWHPHIAHLICLILSQFKPTKMCLECQRLYPIDGLECPDCHNVRYSLARGITGNIEEITKLV